MALSVICRFKVMIPEKSKTSISASIGQVIDFGNLDSLPWYGRVCSSLLFSLDFSTSFKCLFLVVWPTELKKKKRKRNKDGDDKSSHWGSCSCYTFCFIAKCYSFLIFFMQRINVCNCDFRKIKTVPSGWGGGRVGSLGQIIYRDYSYYHSAYHHTSQERQPAAVPELPNNKPHQPSKVML